MPEHTRCARSGTRRFKDISLIFEVDAGYVVLQRDAPAPKTTRTSATPLVTLVVQAALSQSDLRLHDMARRLSVTCDRLVICEPPGPSARPGEHAARFARAVRATSRTECRIVADPCRALRHCVEAIGGGEFIIYCSDDWRSAIDILAEYGATLCGEASEAVCSAFLARAPGSFDKALTRASSAAA